MDQDIYFYRAVITDVYDGDSVTADIDLGFGTWLKGQKLRLYGIDTPEIRGEERVEGLIAKSALEEKLGLLRAEGPYPIMVETYKDKRGKYGRWLAIIWTQIIDDECPDGSYWVNVNVDMVSDGYAREY